MASVGRSEREQGGHLRRAQMCVAMSREELQSKCVNKCGPAEPFLLKNSPSLKKKNPTCLFLSVTRNSKSLPRLEGNDLTHEAHPRKANAREAQSWQKPANFLSTGGATIPQKMFRGSGLPQAREAAPSLVLSMRVSQTSERSHRQPNPLGLWSGSPLAGLVGSCLGMGWAPPHTSCPRT